MRAICRYLHNVVLFNRRQLEKSFEVLVKCTMEEIGHVSKKDARKCIAFLLFSILRRPFSGMQACMSTLTFEQFKTFSL